VSGGSKLWRALLKGVLALSKSSGSQSSSSGARGQKRGDGAEVAKWRAEAQHQGASSGSAQEGTSEYDDSPGRFGNGATRDLTPAEIRSLRPSYSPKLDGDPDPGEVIWTWVPYVENDGRGKDRPVLIVAAIDGQAAWAACYLSTKEHRDFVSIGTGAWDSKGRESFLSPERVLRVTEAGMRRESAGIDRARFERAVAVVLRLHGVA
jgi:hypothetical protein